jgi:hypothetical protein
MNRGQRWIRSITRRENRWTWGGTFGMSLTAVPVLTGYVQGIPLAPPNLHILYAAAAVWTGWAVYHLAVLLLASLLALLRLPVPRLFTAGFLLFVGCTFAVWAGASISPGGAAAAAAIYALIALGGGTAAALLTAKPPSLAGVLYAVPAAAAAIAALIWLYGPGAPVFPPQPSASAALPDAAVPVLTRSYDVRTFTYGSGSDRWRKEFGRKADLVSPTVDASGFLQEWRRPRRLFWGFGPEALPLNGRVWMPEGEGPFPLALVVHGNHYMEYFSDAGFAYLGERLAGMGIITVSVDENFLNYSTWSGGIEPDMTARAWLLLQHLEWIADMSEEPGSAFSGKVDLERIALIGHSRGGQAAALAASFREFFRDAANLPLPEKQRYRIRSVAAIAPIDRAIDGKYITLRNVNYLVLQGAMDGDVNVFYGHRQYSRIRWTDGEPYFKSALYIQGANHSQFNADWGDADISSPLHLLLNRKDLLAGEAQRRVAETYIAAFLAATLGGDRGYLPMLRDYRHARDLLPETTYLQQYEESGFVPFVRYNEDEDKTTAAWRGTQINGEGLSVWKELELEDREGDSLFNDAVYLAWDGKQEAVYEIDLSEFDRWPEALGPDSVLGFDLANADLNPAHRGAEPPEIRLEIETSSGRRIRIDPDTIQPMPPAVHTRFTKSQFFEQAIRNGALGHSAEATLQTFLVPLMFPGENLAFGPDRITTLRFYFPEGRPGRIILDNIGVYPEGLRE